MDLKSVRILIVDDLALARTMVRTALNTIGFTQIDDAVDGEAAMAKMQEALDGGKPYTVVLCDWAMPKMNGMDFVKACRANPKMKDIPVIMVTAQGEREAVVSALAAGAADYIIKPVPADLLQKKVSRVLARKAA